MFFDGSMSVNPTKTKLVHLQPTPPAMCVCTHGALKTKYCIARSTRDYTQLYSDSTYWSSYKKSGIKLFSRSLITYGAPAPENKAYCVWYHFD